MRLPEELKARARAVVYGGEWTPPATRPASTLVLLRDGSDGLEVALLQKAANLGFAKGMYVFPGGALDDADAQWGDPWAVAAIRETFEECGVLLSRPAPTGDLQHLRDADFGRTLRERNLEPDLAALRPFAHWVTPEVESRRFDTRFFAAALPAGQDLAGLSAEHQAVGWFRPEATGELPMLPPTAAALAELAPFDTVAAALAVDRAPVPIMPRPVAAGDGEVDWILVNERTGERLL
ncbi:MAG: NUDIX domain-containing protein [Candidatus Nanopelagicales bacterium]|jgi:8-oxo-dGTP pyrophosphatase MutT (NUDIX family)|nr:NUDIX domain-containing protein [Candidatus Nanopelagicales bacterium]